MADYATQLSNATILSNGNYELPNGTELSPEVYKSSIASEGISGVTQLGLAAEPSFMDHFGYGNQHDFSTALKADNITDQEWANMRKGDQSSWLDGDQTFNMKNGATSMDDPYTTGDSTSNLKTNPNSTGLGMNVGTAKVGLGLGNLVLGYMNYKDTHAMNKQNLKASKQNLRLAAEDAANTRAYRASYGQ